MRRSVQSVLCGLAFLTSATLAAAQGYQAPERRAGYWESTMTNQGEGHPSTMVTQMCTDPAIEKSFSIIGNGVAVRDCSKREMHPIPGGMAFSTTCTHNGVTDVSSGTVTGDFKTSLHMEITTQQSTGAGRHTVLDAKWLGPCPVGRSPGDMVMPGGMVMNLSTGKMSRPGQ